MIDIFSLGLAHLLLVIALLRLARRDDLDHDPDSADNGNDPA